MIEDRDYMRAESEGEGLWYRFPVWGWIIIANAVVFTIQLVVPLMGITRIEQYLALTPRHLLQGRVWELVTFQFLHGGVFHFFCNALSLYMIGSHVEHTLGRNSFLKLYLVSGIMGGLLQCGLSLAFESHFGSFGVIGASAGVFGVIAAFGILFWDESITLLVAFVLPVSIKGKWLLLLEAVLAVWGILRPSPVAHAAHLGGLLMGIFYVKQVIHWDWKWPRSPRPTRREVSRELVNAGSSKPKIWKVRKSEPEEPVTPEEFVSKEVDPILDKISQHGIQSLTEKERKILEAARKKMSKR
jgi:membrane associated rhomboid family serine protease